MIKREWANLLDNEKISYLLVKIKSGKTPVNESLIPKNGELSTQRKEKERKEKGKETTITSFVPEEVCERERWEIWKKESLADEDWRASAHHLECHAP